MKAEHLVAMLGSHTHTWATPPEFFAKLDAEFGFTLDPCCVPETAKCARYYTPAEDGLAQDWSGEVVFMNPPYGRSLPAWMKKAWEESQRGATVVCLVPARTGSAWFHDWAMRGEVRYLRGRVRFILDGVRKGSPAFDSAVVVFRPPVQEAAA